MVWVVRDEKLATGDSKAPALSTNLAMEPEPPEPKAKTFQALRV